MKPTFLVIAALALTSPLIATAKSHKAHAAPKKTETATKTGATSFRVKEADGSVKNYQLEVPTNLPPASGPASKISQQGAVLAALAWAPKFYGSTGTAANSAEFKTSPSPYYLVSLTGKIGDSAQPLYAAVLEDGRIVRPTVTAGAPEKHPAKPKPAQAKKSKKSKK
jgi:hypothetical protein